MPLSDRIAAGKLRHRISILEQSSRQDSTGGWTPIDSSILLDSVPASIEALTGRELFSAQQKVSEVTHRITMRFAFGVEAKQYVRWFDERDRFFQIEAIENPDGRRKVLFLLCVERDDSARGV